MIKQQRGSIIFVSATTARRPAPGGGGMAIAIAKASVESMIKNMAEELGPYGIRVNAVGAGHIVIDLNAGTPQARREQMAQATPDLGGTAMTRQVGEAIRANLSRIALSDK